MTNLELKLASKDSAYQIRIGSGLLTEESHFHEVIKGQQVFIVSNETVAPLYLEPLKKSLHSFENYQFILPDGEKHKSFDNYHRILNAMLDAGLRRNATLIALGGGVVGDMAGFAAATYQRGIAFIQIPTTLLSQVDSSVGGKTAVNHPKGKNMIGAFHQPARVITDVSTLQTLPGREYRAGIAEIIKAAILYDSDFFEWLDGHCESLLEMEEKPVIEMIERSCKIKADIVSLDEKELGVRAWLNLGHTFGHAIERCLGFGSLLHGEAVAIGMVMAAFYAAQQHGLDDKSALRIKALIEKFELPVDLNHYTQELSAAELLAAMTLDKKNVDADLTLILPKTIGQVTISHSIKPQDVERFLNQFLESGVV